MNEIQGKLNDIQTMLNGLYDGGDVTEAARSSLQYTLNEAQKVVKNITYEPVLAPVNYKQHYIEWRDKYFSKVDKVFEYKTKNKTEYFTTEQLHKKYEKAMLESPFNGC